jgi:hypothetical protein
VFLALSHSTARVGGIADKKQLFLEMPRPFEPDDCPDSPAGVRYSHELAEQLQHTHYHKPPAKRCNYAKNGVLSPFKNDWGAILTAFGGSV